MKHLHNFLSIVVLAFVVNGDVNQMQTKIYIPPPPSKTFLPPLIDMPVSLEDFISTTSNSQNEIFQEEDLKNPTTMQTSTISPPVTVEVSNIEQNPSLNAELQSNVKFVSSDPAKQNYEDSTTNGTNSTRNLDVNELLAPTLNPNIIDNNNMPLDLFSSSEQNIVSDTPTSDQSSGVVSEEFQTEPTYGTEQQNFLFTTEQPIQTQQSSLPLATQRNNDPPPSYTGQNSTPIKPQESTSSMLPIPSLRLGQENQEYGVLTEELSQMNATMQIQQNQSQSSIKTTQPTYKPLQQTESASYDDVTSGVSLQPIQQPYPYPEPNIKHIDPAFIQSDKEYQEASVQQNSTPSLIETTKQSDTARPIKESPTYGELRPIDSLQTLQRLFSDPESETDSKAYLNGQGYLAPRGAQPGPDIYTASVKQTQSDAQSTSSQETALQMHKDLQQTASLSFDELRPTAALQNTQKTYATPDPNTESVAYITSQRYQSPATIQADLKTYEAPLQINANATSQQNPSSPFIQTTQGLLQTESASLAESKAQISSEASGYHTELYNIAENQKTTILSSILVPKKSKNTPSVALQYVQQPVATSLKQTESNEKIAPLQYVQQAQRTPVQRTMPLVSPLDFTTNQQYGYIAQQPESDPNSGNNIYMFPSIQQQVNTYSQSNNFPGQQTSSHVNSNTEHLRIVQQAVPAYTTSQGYSIVGSIETNQQLKTAVDQQSHLIFTSPTPEHYIQQTHIPTFQQPARESHISIQNSYSLPAYSNPEFQNSNALLQNPKTLYNQPIAQTLSYKYDDSYLMPQNTQALKNASPITISGQINIPFMQSDQLFSNAHTSHEIGTQYAKNGGYFYSR